MLYQLTAEGKATEHSVQPYFEGDDKVRGPAGEYKSHRKGWKSAGRAPFPPVFNTYRDQTCANVEFSHVQHLHRKLVGNPFRKVPTLSYISGHDHEALQAWGRFERGAGPPVQVVTDADEQAEEGQENQPVWRFGEAKERLCVSGSSVPFSMTSEFAGVANVLGVTVTEG